MNKITNIRDIRPIQGKKVIFTNGCFDILHVGHIRLLEFARTLGDLLVVGLNSDDSVRRLKGKTRPIIPEQERAEVLSALRCIDIITLFYDDTPLSLIVQLRPQVMVKGNDYTIINIAGAKEIKSWGGDVVLFPLVTNHSSSNLIQQLENHG